MLSLQFLKFTSNKNGLHALKSNPSNLQPINSTFFKEVFKSLQLLKSQCTKVQSSKIKLLNTSV
ncbi:MAG: DNA polymerase III psi subunit [Bacteroidia bacterium]|jgi:DNA polymerase III psi subunit